MESDSGKLGNRSVLLYLSIPFPHRYSTLAARLYTLKVRQQEEIGTSGSSRTRVHGRHQIAVLGPIVVDYRRHESASRSRSILGQFHSTPILV